MDVRRSCLQILAKWTHDLAQSYTLSDHLVDQITVGWNYRRRAISRVWAPSSNIIMCRARVGFATAHIVHINLELTTKMETPYSVFFSAMGDGKERMISY